jgi:hypothetical protein
MVLPAAVHALIGAAAVRASTEFQAFGKCFAAARARAQRCGRGSGRCMAPGRRNSCPRCRNTPALSALCRKRGGLKNGGRQDRRSSTSLFVSYQPQDVLNALMRCNLVTWWSSEGFGHESQSRITSGGGAGYTNGPLETGRSPYLRCARPHGVSAKSRRVAHRS